MRIMTLLLTALIAVAAYGQTYQPRQGQEAINQPQRSNYVARDSTDKLIDVRDLTRSIVLSARQDGTTLRMLLLRPDSATPVAVNFNATAGSIGAYLSTASVSGNTLTLGTVDAGGASGQVMFTPSGGGISGAYVSGASVSMNGNILTLNLVAADGTTSSIMFEPTGQSPPTPTTYTSYVGWSADRFIGPSDFTSANSDTDLMIDLPAQSSNAYIWFAVRTERNYPNHLYYHGVPLDQLSFYERQLGQVTYNSNTYFIGVSRNLQSSNLGGTEITIGY